MTVQVFIIYFSFSGFSCHGQWIPVRSFRFRNVAGSPYSLSWDSAQVIHLSSWNSERYIYFSDLFFVQSPVIVSIGPVLYFYVLSLTEDKNKIEKERMAAFVPSRFLPLFSRSFISSCSTE